MKKTKKKLGRPPKHEGERLSKNRTFRVRGYLDKELTTEASKSGRSVSEEIEARLERSFYLDDVLSKFHGNDDAPLFQALTALITLSRTTTSSQSEQARYPVLKAATAIIIDAFAGHAIPTYEDIRAQMVSGTISEVEGNYRFQGETVATEVLQNLGLIKRIPKSKETSK